ncbi:MAG: NAD(P)/FAD-dependent oxidoreductase, partial [Myxococcales bacterium]|nr:NAD(P)/FAD-dependent oxidoreductase [Myxococcales bacterium]
GLTAARELADEYVGITLVDRANHHLFQPLLYQVATAGLSPTDIAVPIRRVLTKQDNVRVLLSEVTAIALDERTVELDDGTKLPFDVLVLAAGARSNYFGNETWKEHTLGLKTVDDALEIRKRVLLSFEAAEREKDEARRKRLMTFVVIGGGPTGVEVAGALSDLARTVLDEDFRAIDPSGARVLLVEMADRVLAGVFDEKLCRRAQEQLEELGVEVRLGTPVKEIDERGIRLGDERIDAATVLWTAGVRGRGVAETLGVELDKNGRVVVEPDCSIPGHPRCFVIGDLASFTPPGKDKPLPGLAPVALQQGRHVAKNVPRVLRGERTLEFSYVDKGVMATIGRSRAVAETLGGRVRVTGFIAWLTWLFVHIWFLIDFRNRVSVLLNWFWAYVTYRRGSRLITGRRPWELLRDQRPRE